MPSNTAYVKERSTEVEPSPPRSSPAHHTVRARIGLKAEPPIDDEHEVAQHQEYLWSRIRLVLREPFAEFWGTFIMVMFGNGSVAQVLLSQGITGAPGGNGFGQYQSISWGYGFLCCTLQFTPYPNPILDLLLPSKSIPLNVCTTHLGLRTDTHDNRTDGVSA